MVKIKQKSNFAIKILSEKKKTNYDENFGLITVSERGKAIVEFVRCKVKGTIS